MAHADDQFQRYREQITALKRLDQSHVGGAAASNWAALSCGFMFGAGFPEASATIAHLYRRAYPDEPFPVLWEGEV